MYGHKTIGQWLAFIARMTGKTKCPSQSMLVFGTADFAEPRQLK